MIREVDLVSYLPEFMQPYTEPAAALEGENPEFDIIWKAVDRVLYNRFISTADEYGIGRFEKILGIYPNAADSLKTRRMRVQNRWFSTIPYTMRVLVKKLTELLGEYQFLVSADFENAYELVLTVYTLDDVCVSEEIDYLLEVMVPLNISASVIYENGLAGNIYFGAVMDVAEIIELKQR